MAAPIASSLAHYLAGMLANAHAVAMDPESLRRLAANILMMLLGAIGLAAAAFMVAGVASRYLQDQPTFTAARLTPNLNKLDPIKGFGRVFGKEAFANFLKALAKLGIVGGAMTWALWPRDAIFETAAFLEVSAILPLAQERSVALMIALLIAAVGVAGVDYITTRISYMERMKMSRREIKDEMRQSEGDPMIRMKLRQIRMERSQKRMMQQVPKATVVITNPTHYAVALRYVPEEGGAPICLAKGVDEVAARIREVAGEHEIPIVEDPPLARALFATAEIDAPIPRAQYEAVAKVIGFVLGLAQRRRSRTLRPNR